MMRRLFGTVMGEEAPSRGRVGTEADADSRDKDAFGAEIQRTQHFSARVDRQIGRLEAQATSLKQQARAYMQQQNRTAAGSCLRRAAQIDAQVAALRKQAQNVGQMAQNAQQTHQSVEAADLMNTLATAQAEYLNERGGARGIARSMRDVTRTVDESRRVQEAVAEALPDDLFVEESELESVDAMLDAMERETINDLAPSAAPLTGYDMPLAVSSTPSASATPSLATYGTNWDGGSGTGSSGTVGMPPTRTASAPIPITKVANTEKSQSDYDFYASLVK